MSYGATEQEWSHFDLVVGITEDLLPVVCRPGVEISSISKLKDYSKTPSQYNHQRKVVGFAKWTNYRTSSSDVTAWSKESDYGICIQTRHVRAIDIDVEDSGKSGEIVSYFLEQLGVGTLPLRFREGTGKCLLALTCEGNFGKQMFDVDGGRVEMLATGQQFVAVGTHKSGKKYQWQDGLPEEFPVVSMVELEMAWDATAAKFGTSDVAKSRGGKRQDIALRIEDDVVSMFLEEQNLSLGRGAERQVFINCPWKDGHSMDGGVAETAYFLAHTRGYQQGHFKCFHASCAHRQDGDFLEALGWHKEIAKDFEELPAVSSDKMLPNFRRRGKTDRIEATTDNVFKAMERPDILQFQLRLDTFRDEIVIAPVGTDDWRPFKDVDYIRIKLWLEQNGFENIPMELIKNVVLLVAEQNHIDTAQLWLKSLKWDGVPRCEKFLETYFNVPAGEYPKAVSLYLWSALAGRVLKPGIKADMVPILVGAQGVGKSTAVQAIAPNEDCFTEITLGDKDDDLARRMRGKLVGEISELRGLHTRDLESIKAFITRTHEHWIPKYKEFATSFPRRIVFVGTTNSREILADDTGNRRWLPVTVGIVNVDAIKADRDQLWAEAKVLYEQRGIIWQGLNEKAEPVRGQYQMLDVWEMPISLWLAEKDLDGKAPKDLQHLLTHDILRGALNMEPKHIKRGDEMRCGRIMRSLGYENLRAMVNGKQGRAWSLCAPDAEKS